MCIVLQLASQVPQGSGAITFHDVRGMLPPFENQIVHTPTQGTYMHRNELVLQIGAVLLAHKPLYEYFSHQMVFIAVW